MFAGIIHASSEGDIWFAPVDRLSMYGRKEWEILLLYHRKNQVRVLADHATTVSDLICSVYHSRSVNAAREGSVDICVYV